jgi:hypothetical protein
MENIDQHIQKDEDLLSDPTISPQARRHTEEELESLKAYKEIIQKINTIQLHWNCIVMQTLKPLSV